MTGARAGGSRPAAASAPARPTRRRCGASSLEETGLAGFDLGPVVWTREHVFAWLGRAACASASASTSCASSSTRPAPTIDLRAGGRRRAPLVDARRARSDGRASLAERARAAPARAPPRRPAAPSRSTSASSLPAVHEVFVIVHLLAAMVWVGGSIALVFAGVPAIRVLEGEPRGSAMKELGLRWRPLGYGALAVAALTGVELARYDWDRGRDAVRDRALGEGRPLGRACRGLVPAQLRLRPAPAGRDPRGPPAKDEADARRRRLDEPEPDDRRPILGAVSPTSRTNAHAMPMLAIVSGTHRC